MLSEIELEALRFFDRTMLEGLQVHSRYLRDLIDRHARSLPLRYIYEVKMARDPENKEVSLRLTKNHSVMALALSERDLFYLFHRVNNAFIHRLEFNFRQENLLVLNYLRTKSSDLQCQVGALCIEALRERIDYALVNFLSVLKPQIIEVRIHDMRHTITEAKFDLNEDYATLVAHNALRVHVAHLVYKLHDYTSAPQCIIPELFGVDVVETCAIWTDEDPLPWIDKFIEMFQKAERGTDIVRTVTLLYERFERSPMRLVGGPLGLPQRCADVPTPHSAFIEECLEEIRLVYDCGTHRSSIAEHFVFANANSAKKLDVYVWPIKELRYNSVQDSYCDLSSLYYAFLLQVRDV